MSSFWDSITGLFDGGGSNSSGDSWFGGFLGDLFSSKNVATGLGVFAQAQLAKKQQEDSLSALQAKFEQEKEMAGINQANAIELLKLKASLGGGGGGSSGVGPALDYYRDRDKYQGQLQAREAQILAATRGSQLTLDAVKNMISAGQRPLGGA